jgi:hypothetical protein
MEDNWINDHTFLFVVFLLLAITILWCGVVTLISLASGWRALARRFRSQLPFQGPRWRWEAGAMRFARYNNCLIVGADPMGIYLSTMILFRPGHPALFIPWTEIAAGSRNTIFGEQMQLTLGSTEQIPFTIRPILADRLKSAAGASWPQALGAAGTGPGTIG